MTKEKKKKIKVHVNGKLKEHGIAFGFVYGLLLGRSVDSSEQNPNTPSDLSNFDDESLRLIIDEGRLQVERQRERFNNAINRGQWLLTVDLALLGILAGLSHQIVHVHGHRQCFFAIALLAAGYLALFATGVATAVAALPGSFTAVDTTQITGWVTPVLRELATDYAKVVLLGELTADLRLTAFQRATRMTVWSAIIAAFAFALTA